MAEKETNASKPTDPAEDDILEVVLEPEDEAALRKEQQGSISGIVNTETGNMSPGLFKNEFNALSPERKRMMERALQGLPRDPHDILED